MLIFPHRSRRHAPSISHRRLFLDGFLCLWIGVAAHRQHAVAVLFEVGSAGRTAKVVRVSADVVMRTRLLHLENDAAYGAVGPLSLRRTGLFDDVGRPADDALPSTTSAAGKALVYRFPEGGRRRDGLRLCSAGRCAALSRRTARKSQGASERQGPDAPAVKSHTAHPITSCSNHLVLRRCYLLDCPVRLSVSARRAPKTVASRNGALARGRSGVPSWCIQ